MDTFTSHLSDPSLSFSFGKSGSCSKKIFTDLQWKKAVLFYIFNKYIFYNGYFFRSDLQYAWCCTLPILPSSFLQRPPNICISLERILCIWSWLMQIEQKKVTWIKVPPRHIRLKMILVPEKPRPTSKFMCIFLIPKFNWKNR